MTDTSEALANTREARDGIAQQARRRSIPVAPAVMLDLCDRMIGWIERAEKAEAEAAALRGTFAVLERLLDTESGIDVCALSPFAKIDEWIADAKAALAAARSALNHTRGNGNG